MVVLPLQLMLGTCTGDLYTCALSKSATAVVTFSHPATAMATPRLATAGTSSSSSGGGGGSVRRTASGSGRAATRPHDDDDDSSELQFTPYDLQRAYDELNEGIRK